MLYLKMLFLFTTDINGSAAPSHKIEFSEKEVAIYRQIQLLSATDSKVDLLDIHMKNHMFGEYEIMAGISQREHSVESQGVVIAFFIDARHMLHLCNTYPQLEEEMWKRAAVTAAKLSQTQAPHDYRHRTTRDLRLAFQNGVVSSPLMRAHRKVMEEEVFLETADQHVFFLRTNTDKTTSYGGEAAAESMKLRSHRVPHIKKCASIIDATLGRKQIVESGPNNRVRIKGNEVAIIYKLKV